jgi:hypothetical protein
VNGLEIGILVEAARSALGVREGAVKAALLTARSFIFAERMEGAQPEPRGEQCSLAGRPL